MAGTPWNAIPIEEHRRRGTYRRDRHGGSRAEQPSEPVSPADRRRTLAGLNPEARRIAAALLDTYDGWDAASLVTLRCYVESVERVQGATDDAERRRETRIMLGLLKALELDK